MTKHIYNSFNNCHYHIFINKTAHILRISTSIALIIKKIESVFLPVIVVSDFSTEQKSAAVLHKLHI
jgi:hypothetical protein